ncbi:MAG: polyphosphate polymerase domain-containing protein [Anaerolineae bacterium]|nr:polyphosphate polymerase domain-containing protein [Anaerolineae bacterium]
MRVEYKYLVPNECLPRLRALIHPFVEVDSYAARTERHEYTVRSIYFDTPNLDFYQDKVDGLLARRKLRIRGYDSYKTGDTVFLEIKRKHGATVTKHRAPVPYTYIHELFTSGDVEQYVLADEEFPEAVEDAKRFLFHLYGAPLLPTALVIYEREAYQSRINGFLRITFDKNLRGSPFPSLDALFLEDRVLYALAGHLILEVKSCGGVPSWLCSAISQFHLKPIAVSKYVICLDRLGLPQRFSRRAILAFSEKPASSPYYMDRMLHVPVWENHPIFGLTTPGQADSLDGEMGYWPVNSVPQEEHKLERGYGYGRGSGNAVTFRGPGRC